MVLEKGGRVVQTISRLSALVRKNLPTALAVTLLAMAMFLLIANLSGGFLGFVMSGAQFWLIVLCFFIAVLAMLTTDDYIHQNS